MSLLQSVKRFLVQHKTSTSDARTEHVDQESSTQTLMNSRMLVLAILVAD